MISFQEQEKKYIITYPTFSLQDLMAMHFTSVSKLLPVPLSKNSVFNYVDIRLGNVRFLSYVEPFIFKVSHFSSFFNFTVQIALKKKARVTIKFSHYPLTSHEQPVYHCTGEHWKNNMFHRLWRLIKRNVSCLILWQFYLTKSKLL